jgi:glutamyl-Q tRNA(Asp) synthetase
MRPRARIAIEPANHAAVSSKYIMSRAPAYVGRFAPSPTGPLHAGSLVAGLASWLDASANSGRWLVRIEDVDAPRCVPGAAESIFSQLAACGLHPDEAPVHQSQRSSEYEAALQKLVAAGLAYPCACTRQDIARELARHGQIPARHGELIYPGTCRSGLHGRPPRAWRFLTGNNAFSMPNQPAAQAIRALAATDSIADDTHLAASGPVQITYWHDRRLGPRAQAVHEAVGDFVLRRADGLWAYQLAVVVDDAAQGITHVVRGEDLESNTARQLLLQRALGLPTPVYLHTPLVLGADGEKLSKQNGAAPLDVRAPLLALQNAASVLGLHELGSSGNNVDTCIDTWLAAATAVWSLRYPLA